MGINLFIFGVMLLFGQAGVAQSVPPDAVAKTDLWLNVQLRWDTSLQSQAFQFWVNQQKQLGGRIIVDHVQSRGAELYLDPVLQNTLAQWSQDQGVLTFEPGESLVTANYPKSAEIRAKQVGFAKAYPTLVRNFNLGASEKGQPILASRITSQKNLDTKPKFKYIANMHGDEIVGRELLILFMGYLVKNYGKNQRITRLLDGVDLWLVPTMNPDGADMRSRFNAKGKDLNRSFPDFTTNDTNNTPAGRPAEVMAIMKFQAMMPFKLSANFHGGAEVVNYPWDTMPGDHPEKIKVIQASQAYADRVDYFKSPEFPLGIVNGYAWYEVDGGMQDWSWYWHKDLQLTIELSQEKWPPYEKVSEYFKQNVQAMVELVERVLP